MKRRDIALVISNLEYGGAQRQLIELANNLPKDIFNVHVVSLSDYLPLAKFLNSDSCHLHVVKKAGKYDFSVVRRLTDLFRQHNVSLAHAFLFDAEIATRLACRFANVPVMIGSERNSNYVLKANQRIAYALTKGLRHLCIANSHAGAEFNSKELGYPANHYKVVYNCVDTTRFRPRDKPELRKALGISEGVFLIGMFASIKPQKNHAMLLKAIHSSSVIKDKSKVLLVGNALHQGAQGTNEYTDEIRQMVRDFDLSSVCEFLGNHRHVERLYAACDVTVLPSHFEGLPNVVLESFACGVPAIVSDVSDNARIVEHGVSGFVVSPDDHLGLINYLTKLLDDIELRTRMSVEARRVAESRFTPKKFGDAIAEIYARELGGRL